MWSVEQIHQTAQSLIKQHGTRDPFELASALNVHVEYNYNLKECKGLYLQVLGNTFVYLNGNLDEPIRRVVLAHELGHDLLHREIAKVGIQEFSLYDMQNRVEYEANLFAADFLLSDKEVLTYAKEQYDVPQIAGLLYTDMNLVLVKMYSMAQRGYNVRRI